MPARNPEAVRQRAIAAAHQRTGRPATPSLDPVFVALNAGVLPARERSPAELYEWVRRDEEYATLGANVVVELHSESHARRPTTRAWATNAPAAPTAATPTEPTAPAGPSNPRSERWWPIPADLRITQGWTRASLTTFLSWSKPLRSTGLFRQGGQ
jgi:hypothetical protein